MIGLNGTSRLLKAVADDTRLRILHLLTQEDLSGSDLMEVLNLGQSRVSTHLNLLKEVGLLVDRREGRRTMFAIAPGPAATLLDAVLRENGGSPEFAADVAGLEVLREARKAQKRAYFDRVAASFGEQLLPGRTWEGLARGLIHLCPRGRYADLGIGDGLLTLMLAEVASSVTAVDVSSEMLRQLQARAKQKGIGNIESVEGDIEDLPLPDASHDVVVMSQALHHARSPLEALSEARRVLVPGGALLVLDLLAHGEEWVREKLEHVHLGFTEPELGELLRQAGFTHVSIQRAARDPQPPHFMTLVASARCGR
ncbi:MAG: metalloregulator ArsR/SmtB family transcription factor [Planctomycetes bacterium]|nr:metalloregulator ArsR/SmtB family transcription factor [Planctomycetota bacterium]